MKELTKITFRLSKEVAKALKVFCAKKDIVQEKFLETVIKEKIQKQETI